MYPRTNIVMIGQVGIVILVLFSYPLQLHPARASLDKFLFPQRVPIAAVDDDDVVVEHTDGDEIPLGRFVVESGALLFTTFLIAMFVSSLETVLGFVGATGSTTISFILPSVFCEYLSLRAKATSAARLPDLLFALPLIQSWRCSRTPSRRTIAGYGTSRCCSSRGGSASWSSRSRSTSVSFSSDNVVRRAKRLISSSLFSNRIRRAPRTAISTRELKHPGLSRRQSRLVVTAPR